MNLVYFTHSLVSDWNHGNAHFLRGVLDELVHRGHRVRVFEPRDGWSRTNLVADAGPGAIAAFAAAYPNLASETYELGSLDLDAALDGADVVVVHEWNDPALVARLGRRRAAGGRFALLFHDTHHRAATAERDMAAYDLGGFDGVLAFGEAIRQIYERRGWARRSWTWHEAADTRRFHPIPAEREGDLVWVGNWGDEERTRELQTFLLEPVQALGLKALVHGVRYPDAGRQALAAAGIAYGGYLPNHAVPQLFGRHRVTMHVPRRPYAAALPGIPTIRVFEALACGIPLVSAPWDDSDGLFAPGRDFLIARDGAEMTKHLRMVLADKEAAEALATAGRAAILAAHTCAHRVDALLAIAGELAAVRKDKACAAA